MTSLEILDEAAELGYVDLSAAPTAKAKANADADHESIVSALAVLLGRAQAEQKVTSFENLVKKRAAEGATVAATKVVKKGIVVVAAIVIGAPLLRALFSRSD